MSMRYMALACDFDGTLADEGKVRASTLKALERFLESGRKLVMVTGRELHDLLEIFPQVDLFEYLVVENGAVLYVPRTREEKLLAEPPPPKFVEALRTYNVHPLSVGKVIVATTHPQERPVVDCISEQGLELQIIFNKGAVMILPSGVNKGSGLSAALHHLGLSLHNVAGIGDAENDHAFLSVCECSAAVANAIPPLKERADFVTQGAAGAGVEELIEAILAGELRSHEAELRRHQLPLGSDAAGNSVGIPPYGSFVLIAGPSGTGKSTVVTAILDRLTKAGYQFCILDPEGDYENLEYGVTLGGSHRAPTADEILQLLERFENVIVNLLGVPMADRSSFASDVLEKLVEFQARSGRPHWLVLDEAHHLIAAASRPSPRILPQRFPAAMLITVHPERLSSTALSGINTAIAVGPSPAETLASISAAWKTAVPNIPRTDPNNLEVVVWSRRQPANALAVRVERSEADRRRHRRKYAEGDIQEKSFYFRGPHGKLNLRAQNLLIFIQIAEGVDNQTWLHHLRQGDYSRWVRTAIKDDSLAEAIAKIEQAELSPAESRARIKAAIEELYTGAP